VAAFQFNKSNTLFTPFKDVDGEDILSTDGLQVIPRPKDMPRFDYAAAKQFCKSKGKLINDLTPAEWSMFQISE
jgi:hypothetical protein